MASRAVRRFPYPLSIGTDICHIPRIYSILNSTRAVRFLRRILNEEELARAQSLSPIARVLQQGLTSGVPKDTGEEADSVVSKAFHGDRDSELWKAAVFMAGRFAAKEAAIKAHTHRRLTLHEVTIVPLSVLEDTGKLEQPRLGSGPPSAIIRALNGDDLHTEAMISISHDGDYATAVCMGVR